MSQCVDCQRPTGGIRCKVCNGREQHRLALVRTAKADRELLRAVEEEHLNSSRLAVRLVTSRTAAWNRVREARRREAERKVMPDALAEPLFSDGAPGSAASVADPGQAGMEKQ